MKLKGACGPEEVGRGGRGRKGKAVGVEGGVGAGEAGQE